MKKLFLPLAAFCILFAACNKDKKDSDVKKLPSKATFVHTYGSDYTSTYEERFEYDNQNRLIKHFYGGSSTEFSYNANSTPASYKYVYDDGDYTDVINTTISYESSTSVRFFRNAFYTSSSRQDTSFVLDTFSLTFNNSGQLVKLADKWGEASYAYNSDGNVIKNTYEEPGYNSSETNITYSNVKAIFRHTGTPDWFIFFWLGMYFPSNGYMPSSTSWDSGSNSLTYETDSDGYATKRVLTYLSGQQAPAAQKNLNGRRNERPVTKESSEEFTTTTFEYISAK